MYVQWNQSSEVIDRSRKLVIKCWGDCRSILKYISRYQCCNCGGAWINNRMAKLINLNYFFWTKIQGLKGTFQKFEFFLCETAYEGKYQSWRAHTPPEIIIKINEFRKKKSPAFRPGEGPISPMALSKKGPIGYKHSQSNANSPNKVVTASGTLPVSPQEGRWTFPIGSTDWALDLARPTWEQPSCSQMAMSEGTRPRPP